MSRLQPPAGHPQAKPDPTPALAAWLRQAIATGKLSGQAGGLDAWNPDALGWRLVGQHWPRARADIDGCRAAPLSTVPDHQHTIFVHVRALRDQMRRLQPIGADWATTSHAMSDALFPVVNAGHLKLGRHRSGRIGGYPMVPLPRLGLPPVYVFHGSILLVGPVTQAEGLGVERAL